MSKFNLDIEIKLAFKAPWKFNMFKSNSSIISSNSNAPSPAAAALVDAARALTSETTVPALVEQVNVFGDYNITIFQKNVRIEANINELRKEKR